MGALLLGAFQPILLVVIVLLVLSSLLASRLAKRIVETFLNTEFEGGRHARRVGLLDAIEP